MIVVGEFCELFASRSQERLSAFARAFNRSFLYLLKEVRVRDILDLSSEVDSPTMELRGQNQECT